MTYLPDVLSYHFHWLLEFRFSIAINEASSAFNKQFCLLDKDLLVPKNYVPSCDTTINAATALVLASEMIATLAQVFRPVPKDNVESCLLRDQTYVKISRV